jgi:hypothetical protein
MKKVYYTRLAIVDVGSHYRIQVDGTEFSVGPIGVPLTLSQGVHPIHQLLYTAIAHKLQTFDFILIPSAFEVELEALNADMVFHPEKYLMGEDVSIGFGSIGREDS